MIEYKLMAESYPFWNSLTENQQNRIVENTTLRRFQKGDMIHQGGQECTGVLHVLNGRIRAFMLSDEGKEITLFRLLEGDTCMLSASCIMKNISFDIQVSAELPTEMLIISPSAYESLSKENPAVATFMNEIIAMRFSEVMWVIEQLLFMKLDKRLAIFLLEQASLDESDTITLTHEQIAAHMGTAREVISRTLKYLAGEGLLSVSRKGITILDRNGLSEKSG